MADGYISKLEYPYRPEAVEHAVKVFENINQKGKGISFIRNASKKMNGNFLIEQSVSHTKAIMTFENSRKIHFHSAQQTDILELISDRLSPVCVEMFGMEYH